MLETIRLMKENLEMVMTAGVTDPNILEALSRINDGIAALEWNIV